MQVEARFDESAGYTIYYRDAAIAPGPGPLPAPPVLFAGSLAACAGIFAVNYLKARDLPFAGLVAVAEADHADEPRRLVDIRVRVHVPAPVEERHLAPLRRAVDLCTLKNTLIQTEQVATDLVVPARVA